VFCVAGRTILAADASDVVLSRGDRFRCGDDNEFVVVAVAFSSAEAWERGRRGIQVDIVRGEVKPGQVFTRQQ
jgi:hypothetical protein